MAETIFAPATGRGPSALCVVRVSGPRAWDAVAELTGRDLPQPRRMALRVLRDRDGEVLDEALVVLFAEGASASGEAMAELHLHGSPAVVSAVLGRLTELPGLRLAEPGEFARRALEKGRLDLAQIEGLADLLAAETEAQRRQAMRVMRGWLSGLAEAWRADLVHARALAEVMIDFSDEDVPADTTPQIRAAVQRCLHAMRQELAGARAAERLREGFEVAVIGPPNAGKSTLINRIARREVAITSPEPGTTRDVLEVRLDLRGLPVTLLDTAGLREARDAVERIGVARARERAEQADLRVLLLPGEGEAPDIPLQPGDIRVRGKADLCPEARGLAVSGVTGAGIDALLDQIADTLRQRADSASSLAHLRQRQAIADAVAALEEAEALLDSGGAIELVAECLRAATARLESLVGRVDVEQVLDEIFARFCLGK
ncbi:MAG: tRNA uridine-5-carboxymethylaminomethyl(34) synthesis GTPase MnmE [Alphaproteobacteria bacterium]|nr:MAG: tRNA uridine-5-carboxymethylaminomethyl(34) synthesis GTPase MnmE [Alphaproteobacteria bacterium]